MKVFISWSGEASKEIAEVFRDWLPSVIQAVRPYFSPDDITKGARWSAEIAKELDECKIGLICLTPENSEAPWVMFEAGALSKSLASGRVCPILFGLGPSDIKGPLVQFQAAQFSKGEIGKVVQTINGELGAAAIKTEVMDGVFEMWWPKLEASIKEVMGKPRKQIKARPDREILDEILARVRIAPIGAAPEVSPTAIRDAIARFEVIKAEVELLPEDVRSALQPHIRAMDMPMGYMRRRIEMTKTLTDRPSAPDSIEVLAKPVTASSRRRIRFRKDEA